MKKTFLLCIDQGTTSCKTALINSNLKIVFSNQIKQDNIFHKPGWSETDPVLMYNKVKLLANESLSKAKELGGSVASIGITNQRESCLIWDKKGKPYSNAILWNDLRTIDIVNDFVKAHKGDSYFYQKKTGKPISTYFSALKYKWMIDNIEVIKQKLQNKEDLCFGTIDSWLLFNLTKGKFLTDVTNASRTKLMNIESLNWDQDMCNLFEVPINCLPQILNNTDNFGLSEDLDQKVPITGVIGDQQSACLAHDLKEGEIKNTYGTGGFLLMDIGTKKRFSSNGLLTTVLFSEKNKKCQFALEGSIESAGNTITWLQKMNIFQNLDELESLYHSVDSSGGVVFVPCFNGLYSPYWDNTARGTIQGLTLNTERGHIVRAAFEGVSFRTRDILHCFAHDSHEKIKQLKVDGGMTNNRNFNQIQSNLAEVDVVTKQESEVTILGSAVAAGLGCGMFESLEQATNNLHIKEIYKPNLDSNIVSEKYKIWRKAVKRSTDWLEN